MKFRITRTTSWDDIKPCEKAYSETIKIPKKQLIFDEAGKKITQEYIVERQIWYIDISSLEELMAFQSEIGDDLIVGVDKEPIIEIYDGYRE